MEVDMGTTALFRLAEAFVFTGKKILLVRSAFYDGR
jgi:hypothetical protein